MINEPTCRWFAVLTARRVGQHRPSACAENQESSAMGISRWFAVIALQAVVTHSASASLLLQIERVSDNMAIVSSAGTLENPGTGTAGLYLPNLQNLLVENPFATALPNLADVRIFDAGSTMAFGPLRTPVSFAD